MIGFIYVPFNYPIIAAIKDSLGNDHRVIYPIKYALGSLVNGFYCGNVPPNL